MKPMKEHLRAIIELPKRQHHPLIHTIHKKHKISRRTLFYMKEYGPHSNVARHIIKESIWILLVASIISSFGGFALEQIKQTFVTIIPFVILLPALNGMIGNYGIVFSSKFSTLLYEGKISRDGFKTKELIVLLKKIIIISLIGGLLGTGIALIVSKFSGYSLTATIGLKIALIILLDIFILVTALFFITITAGLYFYKKKEDPNNFLIPITTSFADLGNMLILTLLIILFF